MSVEVKIGIDHNPRELSVITAASSKDVNKKVSAALAGTDEILTLEDEKGAQVLVPAAKISYVEVGTNEARRVGFGA
ncbi:DUF3107 domain-containing protein [Gordonia zhaorongruii]|uniref:DUF3107 domain-containing protein n=1 Tax=Gordonia zhaorongruii TaxID=2597659 RepID=UPI00104F3B03|nr:DUF3107 domain-containing protein [Gordonia zhaorongruii]